MKLVFICQDPYPYSGACASLIDKLLSAGLSSQGWDVYVVCAATLNHPLLNNEINNTTFIYRFWNWDSVSLKNIIKMFPASPIVALKGCVNKLNSKIEHKKVDTFTLKKNVIKQIHKCLSKIDCGKEDILVPVAGLYETVQAAIEWKNKKGGYVVFYQVDPCSTNYAYAQESRDYRLSFERNVYQLADRIITTPLIYKELQELIPLGDLKKTKTMEFPNLVLSKLGENFTGKKKADVVNCVFSGMIYRKIRDPKYTIELFGRLQATNVVLSLVGVNKEQAEQYMPNTEICNNIKFYGYMSAADAGKVLDEADFLVNIGNTALNQVPSKLFSYIATGKPIINICVNHKCPTLRYMDKYPLSINLFQTDDLGRQAEELNEFIRNSFGKRVPSDVLRDNFVECSAEYCANIFAEICNSLVKEGV